MQQASSPYLLFRSLTC